jgi:hypothetical protein
MKNVYFKKFALRILQNRLKNICTHLQVLHENELDNINNLEKNYKTLKQLDFASRNYLPDF